VRGVPEPLDAALGGGDDVVEGIAGEVGQLHPVEVGLQRLDRVEFGGVAGQRLHHLRLPCTSFDAGDDRQQDRDRDRSSPASSGNSSSGYDTTCARSAAERVKPPIPCGLTVRGTGPASCRMVSKAESLTAP
jgi:hypothetical protein